ncbi:MAG TPA: 4Fe-4S binding protein [Acidobacteriota bacterium]|nr:4Fe-4S binding protein [Acidobacteriota bacterium]
MLANYGYKDGSGDFFITIDTGKCTGCGDCVPACPAGVLAMIEDEFDIEAEHELAAVTAEHAKKIKYSCAPCKPSGYVTADLPCVKACEPGAIAHSW